MSRFADLCYDDVAPGDIVAPLTVPITAGLITAGAIASRDYQNVHHDKDAARELGSPDIFMNILTTNGFVGRYVTDWAGPRALLRKVAIRLGAPNYPGDTMELNGTVTAKHDAEHLVDLQIIGSNRLGDHVTATVSVQLPERDAG